MNEYYAAEPACIKSASDLKHLLEKFGPETGRYLRTYPSEWLSEIEKAMESIGSLAHEKYKTITRRAKEKKRLIVGSLPYNSDESWVDNAVRELNKAPPRLNYAISAQHNNFDKVVPFDDFELPPTAEERIEGIENEYARVCEILLKRSHELVFVDPYLNPCKQDAQKVLDRLLQFASVGNAQKITFIARHDEVIAPKRSDKSDVLLHLVRLKERANLKPECKLVMELYDDCQAIEKMHPRYLLSIWGGIRLDQGFSRLPKGRRVDVSPVSPAIHDELVRMYIEGENDMKLIERLSV
jgi:hypothetical protein